jgi:hypothetical protein
MSENYIAASAAVFFVLTMLWNSKTLFNLSIRAVLCAFMLWGAYSYLHTTGVVVAPATEKSK